MSLNKTFFKGPEGIVIPKRSSDPSLGIDGEIYYNTTLNRFRAYENGNWINADGGVLIVETRSVTAGEDSAESLTLAATPAVPGEVILMIAGAPSQFYGVDFTVTGNILSWDGLGLDGILAENDNLTIQYTI